MKYLFRTLLAAQLLSGRATTSRAATTPSNFLTNWWDISVERQFDSKTNLQITNTSTSWRGVGETVSLSVRDNEASLSLLIYWPGPGLVIGTKKWPGPCTVTVCVQCTDNDVCTDKLYTDSGSDRGGAPHFLYCTNNETLVYILPFW